MKKKPTTSSGPATPQENLRIALQAIVDRQGSCPDEEDAERDHIEADNLLCNELKRLGYGEAVQAFQSITRWYA